MAGLGLQGVIRGDELVRIEEDGVITSLIFARRWRSGSSAFPTLERRVTARLIVPTHLVKQIGQLLIRGKRETFVPVPEDARLH
jgi:hypothetical protein